MQFYHCTARLLAPISWYNLSCNKRQQGCLLLEQVSPARNHYRFHVYVNIWPRNRQKAYIRELKQAPVGTLLRISYLICHSNVKQSVRFRLVHWEILPTTTPAWLPAPPTTKP